jgi:hypothetical protein
VDGPRLQRFTESVLDDVFGQVEAVQAEELGQIGDHLSRFVAEKMVD